MRYLLLVPSSPLDPRFINARNHDELLLAFQSSSKIATEAEVVTAVRDKWPDAIVMPVPVSVGSGKVVLLGVLPDIYKHNEVNPGGSMGKGDIPFVACVQAISETKHDLRAASNPWSRALWKIPLDTRGPFVDHIDVEMRVSDRDTPMVVKMRASSHGDPVTGARRLVLCGEVPGERTAMSLSFDLTDLRDVIDDV